MPEALQLRSYRESDEDSSIALWLETWRQAYPSINFDARVDWWRERWRTELVPVAQIVVAEQNGAMVGFVTIDGTGYLDQLVVSPAQWGSDVSRALVDETKRLSPTGVTLKVNADNIRAIKFYMRNGFVKTGDEVNTSGRAVDLMEWKP
ncbi:GNAT family N-acetyltransferase [Tardiphaga sp. OK245]|uniref:GNAT family N-acetyltransferase n=1 Tax=Tardiphaga sp. OK245 TaxID=1855306 RepID=UPI0008A7FE49|nr:GNAT family N-acetyltransferase [Tardiphaga sp. OK245]SEH49397.1 Acetyltransferase, GNAT family [Tardiphaga sp. OK245]